MAYDNRIRPVGVLADLDPLGRGTIAQQRARLERKRERERRRQVRRQRPRAAKTHRWPVGRAFSDRFRRLLNGHRPTVSALPPPVGVYAGRYEAGIVWREDVETFAAYLTQTTPAGELEARWVGAHTAQYPTVDSLAAALDAYGVGLDPGSLALARTYQRAVWAAVGPCHLAGISASDGRIVLAAVTPSGTIRPLVPSPQRDRRSMPFGPPAGCAWGQGSARGALETARLVLDYVDSTTRSDEQLFHDARTLAVRDVSTWPAAFSISVADLYAWTNTRAAIPVLRAGVPLDRLQAQLPPPAARVPLSGQPNHPEVLRLRSGPTLGEVAAATLTHAVDVTNGQEAPIERPPKRRPPLALDVLQR